MDIKIEAGTNCVNLSENTFPLNSLCIGDKQGDIIEIFGAHNGKIVYEEPWQAFKDSSNARYANKAAVITALKTVLFA